MGVPDINILPDPINFVTQLAATLALFLILRHFLFGPVTEFLEKRKEAVQKNIDEAETKKSEAMKLKEEYEVKIEEAKGEGKEIIETSRKRGEDLREEIVAEAKKEAQSLMTKAQKEIEREQKKAQIELKEEMVTVAMLAASKVIDKTLDEKAHKEMIDKFIDEVGETTWQN